MDPRTIDFFLRGYGMDPNLMDTAVRAMERVQRAQAKIESLVSYNQARVLEAFHYARVSERCLFGSSGYGYGDEGRDVLDRVYARAFKAEAALVRQQFVSGTHAIACALFGAMHGRDMLVCATGAPYDSLLPVIGKPGAPGTIAGMGYPVGVLELDEAGTVDIPRLREAVSKSRSVVFIQRSCGYEWRPSLSVSDISQVISEIRASNPDTVVVVDNCYGEFVEDMEPLEAGADLICGSLIKNPGGGLCTSGGYIAGKAELVELAAERLTCPGNGSYVGSNAAGYRHMYQGFFMAPMVVGQALKGAIFASRFFEEIGFDVLPHFSAPRTDIIQGVKLGSPDRVLAFCRGIQRASAVDSFVRPVPSDLPGYDKQVVMAGGTFVQGSSIELSADAPMREPFAVYLQGGLTTQHVMLGALFAAHEMAKGELLPVADAEN